ncbi:vWA domain-containing protein [Microscilla marina]|uniref:Uncharacterized protein n=1 Tax=Microscilla marina ATCC 23134 TaxID=313606 RepID=A1ZUL7_MICM2|nr:hypothetical protein [Microscilla marina]EAY25903.1 hypothetical protein M23134_00857 [Microscilla marina ATCC 23134]
MKTPHISSSFSNLLQKFKPSYTTTTGHQISHTPEADEVCINGENIDHSYWKDSQKTGLRIEHDGFEVKVDFSQSKVEGIIEGLEDEKVVLNPFYCHNFRLSDGVDIQANKKGKHLELSWNPASKGWKNVAWHRQDLIPYFYFKTAQQVVAYARYEPHIEGSAIAVSFKNAVQEIPLRPFNDCRLHHLKDNNHTIEVEGTLTPSEEALPIYQNNVPSPVEFCYPLGLHLVASPDKKTVTGVLIVKTQKEDDDLKFFGVQGDLAQQETAQTAHHWDKPTKPTQVNRLGASGFVGAWGTSIPKPYETGVNGGPFGPQVRSEGKLGAAASQGETPDTAQNLGLRSWAKSGELPSRVMTIDLERKLNRIVNWNQGKGTYTDDDGNTHQLDLLNEAIGNDYKQIVRYFTKGSEKEGGKFGGSHYNFKGEFYSAAETALPGDLKDIGGRYKAINEKTSLVQFAYAFPNATNSLGLGDLEKAKKAIRQLNSKRAKKWMDEYLKTNDDFKAQQRELFDREFKKMADTVGITALIEEQRNKEIYYHPERVITDYNPENYYQDTVDILIARIKENLGMTVNIEETLMDRGVDVSLMSSVDDLEKYVRKYKCFSALAFFYYVTQPAKIERLALYSSREDNSATTSKINDIMVVLSYLEQDSKLPDKQVDPSGVYPSFNPNLLSATFYNVIMSDLALREMAQYIQPDQEVFGQLMEETAKAMISLYQNSTMDGAQGVIKELQDMMGTSVKDYQESVFQMSYAKMYNMVAASGWQESFVKDNYSFGAKTDPREIAFRSTVSEESLVGGLYKNLYIMGGMMQMMTILVPLIASDGKPTAKDIGNLSAVIAPIILPTLIEGIARSAVVIGAGGWRAVWARSGGSMFTGTSKIIPMEEGMGKAKIFFARKTIVKQIELRKSLLDSKAMEEYNQAVEDFNNASSEDEFAAFEKMQEKAKPLVKEGVAMGEDGVATSEVVQGSITELEGMLSAYEESSLFFKMFPDFASFAGAFFGFSLSVFGLVYTSIQLGKDLKGGADQEQIIVDSLFVTSAALQVTGFVVGTLAVEAIVGATAAAVMSAFALVLGVVGFLIFAGVFIYRLIHPPKPKEITSPYEYFRDYIADKNNVHGTSVFYMPYETAIDYLDVTTSTSMVYSIKTGVLFSFQGETNSSSFKKILCPKSDKGAQVVEEIYLNALAFGNLLNIDTNPGGYTKISGFMNTSSDGTPYWQRFYLGYDPSDRKVKFMPLFTPTQENENDKMYQQQWVFKIADAASITKQDDNLESAKFTVINRSLGESTYLTYNSMTKSLSMGGDAQSSRWLVKSVIVDTAI